MGELRFAVVIVLDDGKFILVGSTFLAPIWDSESTTLYSNVPESVDVVEVVDEDDVEVLLLEDEVVPDLVIVDEEEVDEVLEDATDFFYTII